jgi:hypothetical protein
LFINCVGHFHGGTLDGQARLLPIPLRRTLSSGRDVAAGALGRTPPAGRRHPSCRLQAADVGEPLLVKFLPQLLNDVAHALRIDRKTARRSARAAAPDDLLPPVRRRRTLLDPFRANLDRRSADGFRNAARLTRELARQGYRGSSATVRIYLRGWRVGEPPAGDPTRRASPDEQRLTTPAFARRRPTGGSNNRLVPRRASVT